MIPRDQYFSMINNDFRVISSNILFLSEIVIHCEYLHDMYSCFVLLLSRENETLILKDQINKLTTSIDKEETKGRDLELKAK
jgi:hypothetical protein